MVASGWLSVGGSHRCRARLHSRTCMSQDRRLYFLYLLGVEGWSLGSLRCLRRRRGGGQGQRAKTDGMCVCVCLPLSPRHLLHIVLVATGVLAILNLFLAPLQDSSIGLHVGWVREAGVATKGGPAGTPVWRGGYHLKVRLTSSYLKCHMTDQQLL